MTGTSSRHPMDELTGTDSGDKRKPGKPISVFARPGFGNICLCYVLVLSAFLSPVALLYAFLFADAGPHRFHAHYYYLRTTVALMVIGFSLGCLLIVLGATFSTGLILAGLVLLLLTAVLTLARCLTGLIGAVRRTPPRNYGSYLV